MAEENTDIDTFIKGTCLLMCPQNELAFREREGLLHVLEIVNGTEHHANPKADPLKSIKSYSRSAAGQKMPEASELRPAEILLQTVRYLFHCVVPNEKIEWFLIYEFTFDRLRSVRQDMVMQNLKREHTIALLELITRFYAYAHYRLCEKTLDKFDPKMNKMHLLECLKRLLVLYDEDWTERRLEGARASHGPTGQIAKHLQQFSFCDYPTYKGLLPFPCAWAMFPPPPPPMDGTATCDPYNLLGWHRDEPSVQALGFFKPCDIPQDRMITEALYLLLNLGDPHALARAHQFLFTYRWPSYWTCAYKIAIGFSQGNYAQVCRLLPQLPIMLSMAAVQHLPAIRRHGLNVMSLAFNSQNLGFPLSELARQLQFQSLEEAAQECQHYGIKVSNQQVLFRKGSFNTAAPLRPEKRVKFVDDDLAGCNPTELLLGLIS